MYYDSISNLSKKASSANQITWLPFFVIANHSHLLDNRPIKLVGGKNLKKILILLMAALFLTACGGESVEVKDMYTVADQQEAQQETINIQIDTTDKYSESELKKIIIDASSQYDHKKVNGIRFNFAYDGKGYAEAKIAFNDTGINATGVKKKNVAEVNIK